MPNWTPEFLLATLVVTSIATAGTLGLWAATSRWHWFVRTMAVVAGLTPLLWRPIYEPFITLVMEVAVVVTAITLHRRNWPTWRYSIAGLLLLTVPLAMLVAAVKRGAEPPWVAWRAAIEFGLVGAIVLLVTTWFWCSPLSRRKRVVSLVAALPVLSLAWYWSNYLDDYISWFDRSGEIDWSDPKALAMGTLWGMVSVVMLIGLLGIPVLAFRVTESSHGRHRCRRAASCITIIVASYPAYIAWRLSTPLPVPGAPSSASPAFDALVALSDDKAFAAIHAIDAGNTIDWPAMHTAAQATAADYERMRQVIHEPLTVPVDYTDITNHIETMSTLRSIARRWFYAAGAARRAGDSDGAAHACVSLLLMAHQLEGQGRQSDCLVNRDFESMALANAYRSVSLFDSLQAKQLAELLVAHNLERPSLDPMWRRERIFWENAYGWQAHLANLMNLGSVGPLASFSREQMNWIMQKENAALSALVAVELALRARYVEKGSYPQQLSGLVPEFLSSVPIDPCSKGGEPIIYRRSDEGYEYYSRGYDGDDDDGLPCSKKQNEDIHDSIDWTSDGDLSLERYYADEEE